MAAIIIIIKSHRPPTSLKFTTIVLFAYNFKSRFPNTLLLLVWLGGRCGGYTDSRRYWHPETEPEPSQCAYARPPLFRAFSNCGKYTPVPAISTHKRRRRRRKNRTRGVRGTREERRTSPLYILNTYHNCTKQWKKVIFSPDFIVCLCVCMCVWVVVVITVASYILVHARNT